MNCTSSEALWFIARLEDAVARATGEKPTENAFATASCPMSGVDVFFIIPVGKEPTDAVHGDHCGTCGGSGQLDDTNSGATTPFPCPICQPDCLSEGKEMEDGHKEG